MFFFLIFACTDDAPLAERARWPRPGDATMIEVNAQVDQHGHATAWAASAWTEPPENAATTFEGCRILRPTPDARGLAAVDLTAPGAARLNLDEQGTLSTSGPLVAADARWAVGDVVVLRDDGVRVELPGAVRFGDAPDVLAVRDGLRGDVVLRWSRTADERIEVRSVRRDGQIMECSGGADGSLVLPAYALDPAHPSVTVRAVRETLEVAPNAALVKVRAVVESCFSLADPAVSERAVPKPPPGRRVWEPRKSLRIRTSWG